jgi:hypothetical protein
LFAARGMTGLFQCVTKQVADTAAAAEHFRNYIAHSAAEKTGQETVRRLSACAQSISHTMIRRMGQSRLGEPTE